MEYSLIALSHPGTPDLRYPQHLRLARRSLCLVLVLCPSACLSPTPEYQIPEQVPPFFLTGSADPNLIYVHRIASNANAQTFTLPFRSLDSGEGLRAVFVRDFDPNAIPAFPLMVDSYRIAPDDRPISEQSSRAPISLEWAFPGTQRPVTPPGGYTTLTVILAHDSNFVDDKYGLVDPDRGAMATWLLQFEPSGAQ